jgi:hypothetical protein
MSGSTPTTDDYLDHVPNYNAGQPKFIATLRAVLDPLTSLSSFLLTMPNAFDLDTAIGTQLDQVGLWIGRTRFISTPITGVYFSWDIDNLGWEQGFWQGAFDPNEGISQLDDGTYRALLYAKAMSNVWDSNPEAIGDMLNVLLKSEGVSALITDNQNMSMNVLVVGGLQNLFFRAILQGGYLPIKPEGVSISYTIPDVVQTPSTARITGFGSVTARANLIQRASATIQGQGTVTANAQGGSGTGRQSGSATLGGQGSVIATALATLRATPSLIQGVGSVTANAQGRKLGAATILGAGSVTANSQVVSASTQTWSGTLKNTWLTLSNSNFTSTKTGNTGVYSAGGPAAFKSTGKWYWEVVFPTNTGDLAAGICNPSLATADDSFLGIDANSYGYFPNYDGTATRNAVDYSSNTAQSAFGTLDTAAPGDAIGFALDCVNWKLWTRVNNGAWMGTAGGNPATNLGGWSIPTAMRTGGVGPGYVLSGAGSVVGHFQSGTWAQAAPSGFGAM